MQSKQSKALWHMAPEEGTVPHSSPKWSVQVPRQRSAEQAQTAATIEPNQKHGRPSALQIGDGNEAKQSKAKQNKAHKKASTQRQ